MKIDRLILIFLLSLKHKINFKQNQSINPKKMKRILVPTDFSEHARYAKNVAVQIAKKNNCEIFLLNLLDLPSHMNDAISSGANIPEIMLFLKKTNEKLEELKSDPIFDGINVTAEARIEKAFDGIVKYSQSNDIDLIVMGSHGTSGFQELFIGSNTEKVVRVSDIPVLVVKGEITDFNPKNIVFASDFSSEIEGPFKKIVNFSKFFDAELNLVMINTPNSFKTSKESEKAMKAFVEKFEIGNYSLNTYSDRNIEKGVFNYSNKVNADLIAICTHGRTGISLFLNGSVSEGIVNHAYRPVITFKI